jgi:hypothetical protein
VPPSVRRVARSRVWSNLDRAVPGALIEDRL